MPFVSELPNNLQLVTDSQDVAAIKEHLALNLDYDSFFVALSDGDYSQVFGMYGIVPHLSKLVYRVI